MRRKGDLPLTYRMNAKKENKYLVLKLEKLDNFFEQFTKGLLTTPLESEHIDSITWKEVIEAVKNDNKYIVCNQDEPYAEEVWQTILKGEDAKKRFC